MIHTIRRMPQLRNVFYLLAVTLLIACATTTKFSAIWGDEAYKKGIKKILILGLSDKAVIRGSFENHLVKRLEAQGVKAVASSSILAPNVKLDKETFQLHFKDQGFDAVLVTRLLKVDTTTTNYNSSSYSGMYASPYAYRSGMPGSYGGFYGYYGGAYDYAYSSSYSVQSLTVRVETNIYETQNAKLIWSGVSKTFNPAGSEDAINSLSKQLAYRLKKQGYLSKEK